MFVHFGPNTWQDREYDDRSTPLSAITPDIDTEQWVAVAESLGARYVVCVAKHVGGFCWWQTETTPYSVRGIPWRDGRGDVMADLAASCRRRGLGLGVYLSPRDDTFGAGGGGRCATPEAQEAYNAYYRQQLTELLTRYGEIVEIWFDGSIVVPVGDVLARHAPRAMKFQGPHATIRWVGNEDGFAPYPAWNTLERADAATGIATALHGDPAGDAWLPNEVDVSLRRPNWFWSTHNYVNILALDALLDIYYRSVGRGAQLLLNVTPDRSGRIPDPDAARARSFGAEIRRRFGSSVAETAGGGSALELRFRAPALVDHVIVEEDLAYGERVRAYRLEGLARGRWIALGGGSAIGHKRLQPVGPERLAALRLVVERAAATPHIRRLAAFATGATPPATWNDPASAWADDRAGSWSAGAFDIELTERVPAAGLYRLRFVPEGGAPSQVLAGELLLGALAQPRLVRHEHGRADVLVLTLPGAGQPVRLRGRIRGAASGTVLLRRL
jgi:alpha-L-fucosidase